jgi:hypothetical protein
MKKLVVLAFVLLIPMSLFAAAQDSNQEPGMQGAQTSTEKATTTKSIRVPGKVSDDGKSLMDNAGKNWTVSNPDALKGQRDMR